ncbi:STAS domain-containing protein [Luedemannella flava]|uniref:STAS domain-containing protein n=1 Tax=Luedemannella flava TaxID=349316 RepID=A0ABP4XVC6_9ACTN
MNVGTTSRLVQVLDEHGDDILKQWSDVVAATTRGRLAEAELTRQLRELFDTLRSAAAAGGELTLASEAAAELRGSLTELSRHRARRGFTSTETALSVFALKDPLRQALGDSPDDLLAFVAISQFLDEVGLFTFEAYAKTREELIGDQAEQLLELSTPVIKLWEGVVAIPLVGTLDSARAQVVMERLLQTLVDTGSPYAIIDITGVPAVDTQVAQHILKTVVAARLMGADCIISGIRPQIAQTIVALGIEFGDIMTKASLSDALQHALRAGGFEITRRAPRRA